jgi:hypothetical protein
MTTNLHEGVARPAGRADVDPGARVARGRRLTAWVDNRRAPSWATWPGRGCRRATARRRRGWPLCSLARAVTEGVTHRPHPRATCRDAAHSGRCSRASLTSQETTTTCGSAPRTSNPRVAGSPARRTITFVVPHGCLDHDCGEIWRTAEAARHRTPGTPATLGPMTRLAPLGGQLPEVSSALPPVADPVRHLRA